ncbi:MAG: Helicase associated domain protein [Sedimentisphaerales bacterium]
MATLLELLSNLAANNYVRGRQFEHICKWYLENDPKYRMELKNVWLWKEWPGKWGADAGIDLVAKTYDDKLWAIQAKAYDDKYSIKKTDVDTFLSESSREVFAFRLLIATTNLVGLIAERTLRDQEKPVGQILFSDLEKSAVIWPLSPDKLEAKFQEPKKPRPHQEKAISDVSKGFSEHNRGQLIMACGTGKTLVALWAAEKLESQRTLILLPSLSLLAQTLREWTANASQNFHYLPVCSDDTVRDADHFISRTSELGLPVTTKPDEVAEFLRKQGHIVVFSTYQSSPVIAKAFTRNNVPAFDLTIADEAHRCAGIGTGPFATILDSNAIKTKNRLFMTATPRYFTDRVQAEAEEVDYEIASMDDESKFGPAFHQLTFSEAIKQDLLTDYQVVIVAVDNATYQEYAEKETFVTFDGQTITDARTLASQIALAKAMRKYDLQRIISFHGRIKRAREFSKQLPDVVHWMPEYSRPTGKLWSEHVSGEMSSGRRDTLLNRFRHLEDGERGLLTNARCLGEGVDLPTLDGVAFIDPRHSQLDIVQAVGRVMRKAPDKKIGTVVLPVFIDTEQDSKTALESSAFKPIWDVLKALRAHDDVLADTLDQIRRQLGRNYKAKLDIPEKILVDIPVAVGKSFVESLILRIVERSTASWQFWFGMLEGYVEQKGDSLVPYNYVTKDGYKLGNWVGTQRKLFEQGKLSIERQRALKQLKGWIWGDTREKLWMKLLQRLLDWKHAESRGYISIPKNYITVDGYNLGAWVHSQQRLFKQGKLSIERQKALEQLKGWTWTIDKKGIKKTWTEGFEYLRQYIDVKGSSLVPVNYISQDGFKLGNWIAHQRSFYRKGKLSVERQKKLEELPGWIWNIQETSWLESFEHLRQYVECEGHACVPKKYTTKDGFKLGNWVQRQRTAYKNGELSTEQQKALRTLPKWIFMDLNKAKWQEGFEHLRQYVEYEGYARVPKRYVTKDGFHLSSWVQSQKMAYQKGSLLPGWQQLLEELPGWVWGIKEEETKKKGTWTEGFEHLQKYAESEGHTSVPTKYVTENKYKLGQWVSRQRNAYKQGKLSTERQKALEQLPGWVWNTRKTINKNDG